MFPCIKLLSNFFPRACLYRAEALLNWLVENKIALSCVNIVVIPEGSSIDEIPLGVLQYLPGIIHLELPHARLTQLPDNLLSICPKLTGLDVAGNFIESVPASLKKIVDLSKQKQRIPLVFDTDVDILFHAVRFLLGEEGGVNSVDEKASWLITHQDKLAKEIKMESLWLLG